MMMREKNDAYAASSPPPRAAPRRAAVVPPAFTTESRPTAEALPPVPARRYAVDRYPHVALFAPEIDPARLRARAHELNLRAALPPKSGGAAAGVAPPACRLHPVASARTVRELLLSPRFAVAVSVAPADHPDAAERTIAALDAELACVPRLRRRWLHVAETELFGAPGETPAAVDARLARLGEQIQRCFLRAAVVADRALQRPVFSVFTTTYRTGTRVRRAFLSLLAQELVDWEWVVLDDSPDDGEHFRMLGQLLAGDPRVRLYRRNGNNGSIGDVKNECIGLCRGRYLLELDHDDELTSTCLADCAAAFERDPAVGFVYTDFCNLHEDSLAHFRYPESYGLGLAGYYCRYLHCADAAVSRAGAAADAAFRRGDTWFAPQYVSVTPQFCPVGSSHLVALPNHPRCWRRSVMEHMGSYPEFLPICDDQEILMRTHACGTKMVKLHTVGYLQYMNSASNGSNFSYLRNQEICRMGSTGPLFRLFQEAHPHADALFVAADCDPDMSMRDPPYACVWNQDDPPVYYNRLEHPDGAGVVVYLGMAAVATRGAQFLEDLLGSVEEEAEEAGEEEAAEKVAEGHFATPVHGSSPQCDRAPRVLGRRRRRVVYVMAGDCDAMDLLTQAVDWLRRARPGVTQSEIARLRVYAMDLEHDADLRALFRPEWSTERCLEQYARHMYAPDAEFLRPQEPEQPPGLVETLRRLRALDDGEHGDEMIDFDTSLPASIDAEAALVAVLTGRHRVALAHLIPCAAQLAVTEEEDEGEEEKLPPAAAAAEELEEPAAAVAAKAAAALIQRLYARNVGCRRVEGLSSRAAVLESLDSRRRRYLEIGVETGAVLCTLPTLSSVGVDPAPRLAHSLPPRARLLVTTSDDFWAWALASLPGGGAGRGPPPGLTPPHRGGLLEWTRQPTLVFVDGLHESEQCWRDVRAAVRLVRAALAAPSGESHDCGWVVLDDALPRTGPEGERESRRRPRGGARHEKSGAVLHGGVAWVGDVWRAALLSIRSAADADCCVDELVYFPACSNERRDILALRVSRPTAERTQCALCGGGDGGDGERSEQQQRPPRAQLDVLRELCNQFR